MPRVRPLPFVAVVVPVASACRDSTPPAAPRRDRGGVRAIGRAVNGPGEFPSVAAVSSRDDGSVVAYDPVQRRVSRFDSLGAVREQRSVAVPPSDAAAFRPDAMLGLSPSGDPLVATSRRAAQTDPIDAIIVRRFWVGADDRWRWALPDARADDSVYTLPGGALTIVPFARQPLAAVCGEDLVLAASHAMRVQRWSLAGRLCVQLDVMAPRREATAADLRDGLSAGMPPGMPVPDELVAMTRALRASIEVPLLDRLVCDREVGPRIAAIGEPGGSLLGGTDLGGGRLRARCPAAIDSSS